MKVYPYRVIVKATRDLVTESYGCSVVAYSISDALVQAVLQLEGEHDLTAKGYALKVTEIAPDVDLDDSDDLEMLSQLPPLQKES